MEIGVQTKGIYPERNAKQALQMIRNAGFTNIDFNIDAFLLNTDVYAGRINSFFDQDIEELKEMVKKIWLTLRSFQSNLQ